MYLFSSSPNVVNHILKCDLPPPTKPSSKLAPGASASLKTDIALDALEQALWSRSDTEGLIHHSDRGVQYLSIRYTERLAEAGIEPSVGSKGDSYDNALAESVIGLFKTEVIRQEGPWRGLEEVEFATLDWVCWYNTRCCINRFGTSACLRWARVPA